MKPSPKRAWFFNKLNNKEMKTINTLVLCCLGFILGYSQNYNESSVVLEQERMLYSNYLKNESIIKKELSNVVFITQQGKDNISRINIKAQKSNINVSQKGNKNKVDIDVRARVVNERVVQIGSGNIYQDYNRFNNKSHKMDVYQEGNNQKIFVNGANSISKDLKIIQKGNYKTIFINNF